MYAFFSPFRKSKSVCGSPLFYLHIVLFDDNDDDDVDDNKRINGTVTNTLAMRESRIRIRCELIINLHLLFGWV